MIPKKPAFIWWAVIKSLWNRDSREAVRKQLNQMIKEGVDPLNRGERKAWIRSHRNEVRTAIGLQEPRLGRNSPCSCGSGKKFKKCCIRKAAK